jgi:hypothetical protein
VPARVAGAASGHELTDCASRLTQDSIALGPRRSDCSTMASVYSINRPTVATAPRVSTSDLWLIYRHACTQADAPFGTPPKAVPDLCNRRPFVWDTSNTSVTASTSNVGGFVQGLDAGYVTDPTTRDKARADADLFGVSSDTSPIP